MKSSQLSPEKPAKTGREWIRRYKWQGAIVLSLTVIALVASLISLGSTSSSSQAKAAGAPARTITIWSQSLDSCRRAITGSTFNLTGPGTNVTQRDIRGTMQASVLIIPQGTGYCPYQQGNCVNFANTCLQWHLAVPARGTATYTLKIVTPANGHAGCVGGSVCASPDLKHLSTQLFEFATIHVSSAGACSAQVTNYNPNWTYNKSSVRVFPSASLHKGTTSYACTQTDPVLYHESATLAAVTISPNDCDGDHDADDHTTGAEGWSPMCDNDGDWNRNYRKGQHYTGGVSGAGQ
jgi:hypothetical protein